MLSKPVASLTKTHSSDVFTSDEAVLRFVAYHLLSVVHPLVSMPVPFHLQTAVKTHKTDELIWSRLTSVSP